MPSFHYVTTTGISEVQTDVSDALNLPDMANPGQWVEVPFPASRQAVSIVDNAYVITLLPPPPPSSVTPLQMRKAIRAAGYKTAVDSYIATLGSTEEGAEALEAWDYALSVERTNPFIDMAASGLGLTSSQVDDLFILAATM